ncbi:acetamidase [Thermococcus chitonophagus]|uniref:Acetamidase n=1 Tax=Thermococcus chitonophagus TaxID=54262 RepID=A0A160VRL8_9EURY|nr:acetamidase/formamidase family protein [Thermococcus chitonophagus]ASJ17050.1 acetamidase [Thermococcus chitonophagus]CUX77643.1 predicted acetamidase/formamidase [Thermococcus chitonophagus]
MPAEEEIYNDVQTNGIIGPHTKMLGPVADGGRIIFVTAPGCWGPMITPTIRGGHEVNVPVAVDGAEVGDAIAIKIEKIRILSKAASSGVDEFREGAYVGDPYVAKKCPTCNEPWPEFEVVGIGEDAIRCKKCGSPASPFKMKHGYTMVFDHDLGIGITVDKSKAEEIAKNAWEWHALPKNSKQVPILIFAKADLVGIPSRIRPFLGQLGTVPAVDIPDSHNAGDFGYFLIDAPHPYAITKEDYETKLTDGHLDVDSVREGAIVIAPVKIKGGGIYAGDAHAMQGDGEVAGHTTDVTAETTVSVSVIKNLRLDGPLLLPPEEDLPPLAKPWRKDEWEKVEELAKKMGIEIEPVAPIQVIGSGPNINNAAINGFKRAAELFEMSIEEVRNRVTITGAVEIGRLPGIVQVTLQVPLRILEKLGIDEIVVEHYKLPF